MRPGPFIRRLLGPCERQITEAYRRIFTDLDDFAGCLQEWVPRATRILEIGCGEGAMTERLVRGYPGATITAIDITPNIGRLFRGDASRVTFIGKSVEDVAWDEPASFDLAILCDVLHHVPPDARPSLLGGIDRAMAVGGSLAFKDWAASSTPIHWLCRFSDRYLTGDDVRFCSISSAKALLIEAFGRDAIRSEALLRPWSNNFAILVRR
jgi:SAM-dependent methyltransferase